jgi:putative endonuclease
MRRLDNITAAIMNAADRKEKRGPKAPRGRSPEGSGAGKPVATAGEARLSAEVPGLEALAPDASPHEQGAATAGRWWVYLVRCRDGSLYAGCTNNLTRRLLAHNAGKGAAYTRSRGPVALAWWEVQPDRSAALRREWAIKQLTRRQKLALVSAGPPD